MPEREASREVVSESTKDEFSSAGLFKLGWWDLAGTESKFQIRAQEPTSLKQSLHRWQEAQLPLNFLEET
jgi:hypothetical protein